MWYITRYVIRHVIRDMWHMTHDTWHTTHDTRHTTHDTRYTIHDIWHMTYDMRHDTTNPLGLGLERPDEASEASWGGALRAQEGWINTSRGLEDREISTCSLISTHIPVYIPLRDGPCASAHGPGSRRILQSPTNVWCWVRLCSNSPYSAIFWPIAIIEKIIPYRLHTGPCTYRSRMPRSCEARTGFPGRTLMLGMYICRITK